MMGEKLKKYLILFLYIALFLDNANASSSLIENPNKCQKKIDLRNDSLGSVRDQDSIGWCYAFAASDLLSYKLKKKISAADLAINFNDTWLNNLFKKMGNGEQDFAGGQEDEAIKATSKKGGACLEENFKSDDNGYAQLKTTLETIDHLQIIPETGLSSTCSNATHALFPHVKTSDYLNIMKHTSRNELVRMLSAKACAPRIPLDNLKPKLHRAYLEKGRYELFNKIDQQLSNNNIVSIGYNAKALFDINTNKKGAHASVVVGRRFNARNGECEYLIRNSWGRGCSAYDRRLSCEEGNIWVPKSVLVKGIIDVTYL